MMMTHPDDPDYNITDSAAAGTALATGVKTYNNAIGVDKNGKKVKSVLEEAKQQGKSTGLSPRLKLTTPLQPHMAPTMNHGKTWTKSPTAIWMTR